MEKPNSAPLFGKNETSNKKITVYAIIGIVVVAAFSITMLAKAGTGTNPTISDMEKESRDKAIALFKERFCGPDTKPNSNSYINEVVLPNTCEMPLGITVDNDRVWYVSTKQGILGSYNIADGKFEEFLIPSWQSRSNPTEFSMSWAVKTDPEGNIWLTDNQNLLWRFHRTSGTFDMFKSPADNPISFDFDSEGNIYLVGVRSKSLYFADVSHMRKSTSDGFTEIRLPLEGFAGIENFRVSSGSVVVDRDRNAVWTSVLAFQVKGEIFRYDIATKEIKKFDLPQELNSPVGTAVDSHGNLWVTDHGTSIFFMLNPVDGRLTKYVTSVASNRIYGGITPADAYTLPYWIQKDSDGNIWFNQHEGNKISRFDPSTNNLVEYWIPTQNGLWANCPENAKTCGVANSLQFSIAPNGQVWFTEWSENKIGTIRNNPITFSVSAPEEVTVKKGDSVEVKVDVSSKSGFKGNMIASGTFTNTGALGNSTGIFSEGLASLDVGGSKQFSYVFTPASGLPVGSYVLMLGVDDGDATFLKAVKVNVV